MKRIIDILMNRDNISIEEATLLVEETQQEIMDAVQNGDAFEADDILMSNLGLEPDYMMDILI